MHFTRWRPGLQTTLLTLLAAILFSETFMARRNILAYKQDWKIAQEGFINPGLNALPDLIYRRLLTGYRLRSDHIMGIQRIFSRTDVSPEKLEAWFRTGPEGYLDLLSGGSEDSYIGIRLSGTSVFPSMVYEADNRGKYLRVVPLKLDVSSGFHHARVEKNRLFIDKESLELPPDLFRKGRVGVQVSFKDTELFAFSVAGKERSAYLHFFPDGNRTTLYGQTFLILLLLISTWGHFRKTNTEKPALLVLGTASLLFMFQLSHVPQNEEIDETKAEFRILDAYWKPAGEKDLIDIIKELHVDKFFPGSYFCRGENCQVLPPGQLPPPKLGKRILFFGGSQIHPSLVTGIDQSLFYRFARSVGKENPDTDILNLNSLGLFSERLGKFGDVLPKLGFDEIIIETLSFTEEVEGIIRFIREWTDRGVKVYFLRRPINPLLLEEKTAETFMAEIRKGFASTLVQKDDFWPPEVIRIMPQYRKAQAEIGFTFLDPNELLLREDIRKSGELFWDGFHFTAWGQELVSDWLAGEYLKHSQSSK